MATKKVMKEASNNALNKFFSEPLQEAHTEAEPEKAQNVPTSEKKPLKKAQKEAPKKAPKKVFAFRADEEQVKTWRVYADARSGKTMDEIGMEAMTEYMKNHPLAKVEMDVFKAKMKLYGK